MKTWKLRFPYSEKKINSLSRAYAIPSHDLRALLRDERKVLVSIYKKTGRYNCLIGAVILLMYALRRIGLSVSFLQSACLAVGLVCGTAGCTGCLAYNVYHHLTQTPQQGREIISPVQNKETQEIETK